MKTTTDLTQREPTPAVLTIGSFDGVHIGHRRLISEVAKSARERGVPAVALTFEPSPREVLRPGQPLAYLTRLPEKLHLLAKTELDETVVVPFTEEMSRMAAPDFVKWVRRYLPFVELWEGEGFALGHERTGNTEVLARLGDELGYTVEVAPLVLFGGDAVSSTRIRGAVMAGDVEMATLLLGRPPSLPGTVVPGSRRGSKLGYPTANLATPPNIALPADGVYATWTVRHSTGKVLPSVTSIGTRPTFEDDARLVEVHILGFKDDLYGEKLTLHFVEYLRPQTRYAGIEPLVRQMDNDTAKTRRLLLGAIAPEA